MLVVERVLTVTRYVVAEKMGAGWPLLECLASLVLPSRPSKFWTVFIKV